MDAEFPERFSVLVNNAGEHDRARFVLKENGFEWDSGKDMMSKDRAFSGFRYLDCYTDGRKRVLMSSDPHRGVTVFQLCEFEAMYANVDIEPSFDLMSLFA